MNTEAGIHFTPREMEVIRLLLLRQYRKKIGIELHITSGTVDNHIKHMFSKTSCHSMGELIIYLLLHGFAVNKEETVVTFNGNAI
jgi:DNA-binding CsgD family transcriptional regulator